MTPTTRLLSIGDYNLNTSMSTISASEQALLHYIELFHEAMLKAFTVAELTLLVRFKLNIVLDDEVGPGPGKKRIFDLLTFLESEGRLIELFIAAMEKKPGNPALQYLLQTIADSTTRQHNDIADAIQAQGSDCNFIGEINSEPAQQAQESPPEHRLGHLQAMAVATTAEAGAISVTEWQRRQQQVFNSVCLIRIGNQPDRTGILISPDTVITCFHSLNVSNITQYQCVFDYHDNSNLQSLLAIPVVDLLASNAVAELDFAILRLAASVHTRTPLCVFPHEFTTHREPLIVVGHPSGEPMRPSVGVVMDHNVQTSRVAYSANTQGGSSGSAVLTNDYKLVAMHHHGQANMNNHGVPFLAIYNWCAQHGYAQLLQLCQDAQQNPH